MDGKAFAEEIKKKALTKKPLVILNGAVPVPEKTCRLYLENPPFFRETCKTFPFTGYHYGVFRHQAVSHPKLDLQDVYNYASHAKVLLAEDNPINQMVAVEILTLAGMHVPDSCQRP
ncbi:MAG: hypothetical protein U5K27_02610 [Desulfotignum sp.]|nr:hypothetical protein [Desulfotignum sp.]